MLVSIMHLAQLLLMLAYAETYKATCLEALFAVVHVFYAPDGAAYVYVLVIASIAIAIVGAFARLGWARLAFFAPQFLVLAIMAIGGIAATAAGYYLDGTVIARPHIAADQMAYLILFARYVGDVRSRCQVG